MMLTLKKLNHGKKYYNHSTLFSNASKKCGAFPYCEKNVAKYPLEFKKNVTNSIE